jgi:hypothetical protein
VSEVVHLNMPFPFISSGYERVKKCVV